MYTLGVAIQTAINSIKADTAILIYLFRNIKYNKVKELS
jgi:hypothetical protein